MARPQPDMPEPRAQVIAYPYGGAVEVARADLDIHRLNVWTRRCRCCGERHPCDTRQRALAAVAACAR